MNLKLVLLDADKNYLSRLVAALSVMREQCVETYSFTDMSSAMSAIGELGAGFFVAGDGFEVDIAMLPAGFSFAYFSNSPDQQTVRGQRAICRYQKAELILKEIQSIYADRHGVLANPAAGDSERKAAKVYCFFPCGGGVGASSAAAACALRFARSGKRVLYLNIERFGTSETFFEAEGRIRLGDVLYAIKSGKSNLEVKLTSAIKLDESGVFFIDSCRASPEMMEINGEDILALLEELNALGSYEYILIDSDLLLEGCSLAAMKIATCIVLVSNGSEVSLVKLRRIRQAMGIIAERDEFAFPPVSLLYNQFSSKTGRGANEPELTLLGGAPKYEGASQSKVIRQLAELPVFDKLL